MTKSSLLIPMCHWAVNVRCYMNLDVIFFMNLVKFYLRKSLHPFVFAVIQPLIGTQGLDIFSSQLLDAISVATHWSICAVITRRMCYNSTEAWTKVDWTLVLGTEVKSKHHWHCLLCARIHLQYTVNTTMHAKTKQNKDSKWPRCCKNTSMRRLRSSASQTNITVGLDNICFSSCCFSLSGSYSGSSIHAALAS